MKTPMQELIEQFEDRLSSLKEVRATAFDEMKQALDIQIEELEVCILSAEYMLEKEDDVSKQSELLKDFRKWWNEDNQGVCTTITHKDIERYLESL